MLPIKDKVILRLQELTEPLQAWSQVKSYADEKATKVKDKLSAIRNVVEDKHTTFTNYSEWMSSYKEKQTNFLALCEKIENIQSMQEDIDNFEIEYLTDQLNLCKVRLC